MHPSRGLFSVFNTPAAQGGLEPKGPPGKAPLSAWAYTFFLEKVKDPWERAIVCPGIDEAIPGISGPNEAGIERPVRGSYGLVGFPAALERDK
jgi:hypothetical protein